jgi:ferritin-like metal-binding protein YciE
MRPTVGKRMAVRSGGAVERLARLETQMEGVKFALDRGSASFEKFDAKLDEHAAETRKQIAELKSIVSATHAACVKAEDLQAAEKRVEVRVQSLETFRDRVKRYGILGGGLAAAISGALALFGPTKVGEAFSKLWE